MKGQLGVGRTSVVVLCQIDGDLTSDAPGGSYNEGDLGTIVVVHFGRGIRMIASE